jgi:hypothetical protein
MDSVSESSLLSAAMRDGVETEKCVVAQHRTTKSQKDAFVSHMKSPNTSAENIPVEWVIDIADEKNGWFYGTAYHFNDKTRMVHVMIPDKHNPTFDGHVQLDHRTMHLIECVDGKTDALFNKIVRDSIIKIRWELQWFEEDVNDENNEKVKDDNALAGRWVDSVGRYYIRIANQLLVEDEEVDGEKGFVMIAADVNVRLHHCGKGRGQEEFNRLVLENQVQSTPAGLEEAQNTLGSGDVDSSTVIVGQKKSSRRDRNGNSNIGGGDADSPSKSAGDYEINNELVLGLNKVWDMTKDLKECVSELLDEKDKEKDAINTFARAFSEFSMDGDLDAGLRLHVQCEEITVKEESKKKLNGRAEREANENALDQDVWHLVQRVEKGLNKLVRSTVPGDNSSNNGNSYNVISTGIEKRNRKVVRKDLDARERELNVLKMASAAR